MKDQVWRGQFCTGGWCESCDKFGFVSRRAAKRVRRQTPNGRALNIYQCPVGDWHRYHLGTLPAAVKRGDMSRDEINRGYA